MNVKKLLTSCTISSYYVMVYAFVCVFVFVCACVHTFVCGYLRTDKLPIPISHVSIVAAAFCPPLG